ncbi:hypothetical protein TCAL_07325 [Tigriopus californicus]|uniref:Phenazine biosynthesis-like domain-containing protein n=1 Tax=Tigriopus californicus TaxID=6832 RepID=A0A553PGU8_TIGCA|nr:uncharacterized isomerase PA3578-like isoform X1 [Tigriopus californicus]XP_059083032.1 uncharacterized isomerase PA3578-like isoform X1 [Tigriopus californicus]TRY76909.1 hypothetical protein TCAL_07325 [Tigriopus californicus]
MRIPIYQVDAFTTKVFGGNPAAVCLLTSWLDPSVLLSIAKENNLSETAFVMPTSTSKNVWKIRWFTPDIEMDLCGHATLAAAHVVFEMHSALERITFISEFSGKLDIEKVGPSLYQMALPSRPPAKIDLKDLPESILRSIKAFPVEAWRSRDVILVYDNEEIIRSLNPDSAILNEINLDPGGVVVTAKATLSQNVDFVSRYFTPQSTIFEDPVTGSAHCSLVPLWAKKLAKQDLKALQVSSRAGELTCSNTDEWIFVQGHAVTFLQGHIQVA